MSAFNLANIVDLLEKAQSNGIRISLDNDKLLLQTPKESVVDHTFLEELKLNKTHLIEYFKHHVSLSPSAKDERKVIPVERKAGEHIPLSYSQERLWFIDRLEGSVPYHIPIVLRLRGKLDENALQNALQTIINRHEVLRTVIVETNGMPAQHILDKDRWQLPRVDSDETRCQSQIATMLAQPFDLSADHPLRATLLVLSEEEHILVMTLHHIAADGWSSGILVHELTILYEAYIRNLTPVLPALPVQYADYAIWQRNYLSADRLAQQLHYWKSRLADVASPELPADYPRRAIRRQKGAVLHFDLNAQLAAQLQALSRQEGATLFMTLLAAFKVLLYRYSGQTDICVGTPTAGRTQQETEGLIGFFINTLALRSDLSGNPSFTHLLQQVKSNTLHAYDHQDTPFEKIVEAVVKERDLSRSPLFQVMFILQNAPAAKNFHLGELELLPQELEHSVSQFDLTISVTETPDGLHGFVNYDTDLFLPATIAQLLHHYQQLLQAIAETPAAGIGSLSIPDAAEQHQLLVTFNDHIRDYSAFTGKTIIDVFEVQVEQTPAAAALVFEEQVISYQQLQERSNQLAHYLHQAGVTTGTLVPVLLERSPEMIIAILGILKAGGAYVPIDTEYPAERIAYVLDDTQAAVIITTCSMDKLPAKENRTVVLMETIVSSAFPATPPYYQFSPDDPAYLIYTSGSTGKPKGVIVEHKSVINLALGMKEALLLEPGMKTLQFASVGFDAACFETFNTLLSGGCLVLAPKENLLSPDIFRELIRRHDIAVAVLPPSFLHPMKDALSGLRTIVSAGEPLGATLARHIQEQGIRLINAYGPTESTVCASLTDNPVRENDVVVIGKPVPNVPLYVLDADLNLSPLGGTGELCIGGIQVARGYLHRPELTAERFIANPFMPGDRLYKTGDLVRWLPDGHLMYLGRKDEQVKIRGHRIELGEITAVLESCPQVSQAVVIAHADGSAHKRLIAYIVPDGTFDQPAIQSYLKVKLPDYMVPSLLYPLPAFPLTPNGKIDRKALPAPDMDTLHAGSYVAPRNAIETSLAGIWQELLQVPRIGIYDNFFERGGDSIITIQVVSRAKRAGYELHPRDIFLYQTIAQLAVMLEGKAGKAITGEQGMLSGVSGLLPIQQWYFGLEGSQDDYFNQRVLLSVGREISTAHLSVCIQQLLTHHDALRFTYRQGIQSYGDIQTTLVAIDLQHVSPEALPETIENHCNEYQRRMRISDGILFQAVLLQTPASEKNNRLLLAVHHLAMDGVSWRILLEDLTLLLEGGKLPAKGSSYRQWQQALTEYGERRRLLQQQTYWEQSAGKELPLRTDYSSRELPRQRDKAMHARRLTARLTTQLLQETSRAYHTDINDILLSALAVALSSWNGHNSVLLGMEGHGREDIDPGIDTSRTVGWFTSLYPVLLQLPATAEEGTIIRTVKEQLRRIPDKGLGYGVLKYLNKTTSLQGKDPWEVTFNYLGRVDNIVAQQGMLTPAPESGGSAVGEKFPMTHKLGITGMIAGGELILQFDYSTLHLSADSVEQLSASCLQTLEQLISHCISVQQPMPTPSDYGLGTEVGMDALDRFLDAGYNGRPRREQLTGLYRLSGLQEGMLFHTLYDDKGATYTEQISFRLHGVNIDAYTKAWQQLLQHHTILRTAFYYDELPIPVQAVYKDVELPVTRLDYRHLPEEAQQEAIRIYEKEDAQQGFDFTAAPLMRLTLIRLTDNSYWFLWTSHHVLLDGWSTPVLVGEMLSIYQALIEKTSLPVFREDQFEDYIRLQERRNRDAEEQYWRHYLADVQEGTLLPFITAARARTRGGGSFSNKKVLLGAALTEHILQYAQQHHITASTLMQGVWAFLLYCYTGRRDVVYGVTVSGRPGELANIEKRVGLYINTLLLYAKAEPDSLVLPWLQSLQENQLQSREYQYVSLNDIRQWTGVTGELFDTSITFQNFPVKSAIPAEGDQELRISDIESYPHTNYPLTIIINVGAGADSGLLMTYNNDLLPEEDIDRIAAHFETVLRQMTAAENVLLRDIQLTSPDTTTAKAYTITQSFCDHFENNVASTPHATAVVYENEQLTYDALNRSANQLAHRLLQEGIGKDALVPLLAVRSVDMLIGMLGILKAGAAYVPMDPEFPQDRIAWMLEDTRAEVMVITDVCRDKIPAGCNITLLAPREENSTAPDTRPAVQVTPSDLLYVIYTSGSTGRPKGVMITHGNLMDYLYGLQETLPLQESRSFGLLSSIATDLGNTVLFGALFNGAALHVLSKAAINDGDLLHDYCLRHQLDCFKIVPSHWKALSSSGRPLLPRKLLIFGGEALESSVINELRAAGAECCIANHYGPTETTIGKLVHSIDEHRNYGTHIPVGRPFSNTRIYVLHPDGKPCPVGVPGELLIGGDGLAAGYLNQPALTSEKFIPDPFVPDARCYRTGDLVKYLPDGNILFLGRVDDQVKIRGYRVEPGEIEKVLNQYDDVLQSVITAHGEGSNKRLIAYLVPAGEINEDALHHFLETRLPDYMIPAQLISLDRFPLLPNGKIDRRALPEPGQTTTRANSSAMPETPLQLGLAAIWQQLLEVDQVGLHDDFFKLGGHSLLAIRVISAARKSLQLEIAIGDIFDYPTIATLSAYISSRENTTAIQIGKQERPAYIPLSFSQERLWFIDQLEGSVHYHLPVSLRLRGKLNREALSHAFRSIADRHEVLRTVIRQPEEGAAYQHILEKGLWQMTVTEHPQYRNDPQGLQQYLHSLIARPFDLSRDHGMRVQLIVLDKEEYVLLLTLHHIVSDGWSNSVLIKELVSYYNTYTTGVSTEIPGLPLQYADYALWQRDYMKGEVLQQQLQYWKNKLTDTPALQLPTDYPRPAVQSNRGAALQYSLPDGLSRQLQNFSQQQGVTLFMTMLAAFKVLLYRYSGQNDICVGTSVAGREHQELEGLIGFFINTLALRSNLSGTPAFDQFLQQVKQTTLAAYEHQLLPFEKVVEVTVKERNQSRNPLFQVIFEMYNTPATQVPLLGDVQLLAEHTEHTTSKCDMTVAVAETERGMLMMVEYSTDLFVADTVNRMLQHYQQLLLAIVATPAMPVNQLPLLSAAEKAQVLYGFNDTATDMTPASVLELFRHQAALHPDDPAVLSDSHTLTYGQVETLSGRLAAYLRLQGVTTETPVPVCMGRSPQQLIAILAIWKAGGVYVPIDPAFPDTRIRYILEDTGATCVICSAVTVHKMTGVTTIIPEEAVTVTDIHCSAVTPEQLAYIIYTSGSTGRPKGVMITHGSLHNYLCNSRTAYICGHGGSFVHLPDTFDASLTALLMPLISGRPLVMGTGTGTEVFTGHIFHTQAPYSFIKLTPAHMALLEPALLAPSGDPVTKTLVLGGEALQLNHLQYLLDNRMDVTVINEYGPTEATVGCCVYALNTASPQDTRQNGVLIGKPIDHTRIYILDDAREPVPVGVFGEMYIAGRGVARGYLNLPALTAEKFLPDPFSLLPGEKMYRSGDIGRWLPDGNIEYAGRKDEQVKIRGYRIEPGEIEGVLEQCDLVKQAVVAVKGNDADHRRLVAYVVPAHSFDRDAIFAFLKTRLPEYMLPAQLMALDSLPLTANGKINRRELPDPELSELQTNAYMAPRNETEQRLVSIWENLLETTGIGIQDNFFTLGGHSLLAIRLTGAIRKAFGIEISIGAIFDHPTILQLKQLLEKDHNDSLPPVTPRQPDIPVPLSFSQERLWFLDQLEGTTGYHVPVVLRLEGPLDAAALEKALAAVVDRHEILRTVYVSENDKGRQLILEKGLWKMDTGADENIASLIQQPFDLSREHPFRARLTPIEAEVHLLVLVMHHIAFDDWSMGIFLQEFTTAYAAYSTGSSPVLPELEIQYADYALWQHNCLSGPIMETKLAYWQQQLADVPPLELPTDFRRPAVQHMLGERAFFHIDTTLTTALQQLAKEQGVTLYMTLLAAFNVLLQRYSGQDDICVGTSSAGRQQKEVESLIGFFVNTLALRSDLSGNPAFTTLLQQVKQTTLAAYEHQQLPFEKIVETVVKERDMSRSPLFQVMLVLQNAARVSGDVMLGPVELFPQLPEVTFSKFDLTFFVEESAAGLQFNIVFRKELYKETTIARMFAHYEQLLRAVVAAPQTGIDQLPLLLPGEANLLLDAGRAAVDYPREHTLLHNWAEQVRHYPETTAVVAEDGMLTLHELDIRSGQLARYLQQAGVTPGTLVPVCMEKSVHMMVSMLGIWKAGAAYVPIDPEFPAARIDYILEDTAATVVITDGTAIIQEKTNRTIIVMGETWETIGRKSAMEQPLARPTLPAYVIYTSGSTGKPKGVIIHHSHLMDYVYGLEKHTGILSCRNFALVSGFATDLGNTVIFAALAAGGALHLLSKTLVSHPEALHQYFRREQIDCIKIVPSHWKALSENDALLLPRRLLVFGGEALDAAVVEAIRDAGSGCKIVNHYGPTETTIGKLLYVVPEELPRETYIPVGKPFSNTGICILDKAGRLCPAGVPGELYIGGEGVAAGYLNNETLTAERFIPNPFDNGNAHTLYRTGDLVKYLPDGNILFIGRADDQVKIRGYRVEPGEVERVMQQCTGVEQAAVVVRTDGQGNKRLIGYVVLSPEGNAAMVADQLSAQLPEYMVPSQLLVLDRFPILSNGKTDRKALPDPEKSAAMADHVPPQTGLQQQLASIWEAVLETDNISINDDFFRLGGHSLLAIRLTSAMRKNTGVEVSIGDVFDYPTISRLADVLETRKQAMETDPHIEWLNNNGNRHQPLFAIPGSSGECSGYHDLSDALAHTIAVCGLQMKGTLPGESPLPDMEAIAAYNITLIKQLQPSGPYHLIGYSFGGFVLFEMVRQLEAAGDTVAMACILDTNAGQQRERMNEDVIFGSMLELLEIKQLITPGTCPEWLAPWKTAITGMPPAAAFAVLVTALREAIPTLDEHTLFELRLLQVQVTSLSINYPVTGTIQSPVMVVKAMDNTTNPADPYLGWQLHAPHITAIALSGTHQEILKADNAALLAQHMLQTFSHITHSQKR